MEEKKTNQLEETEAAPIETKKETIHFQPRFLEKSS